MNIRETALRDATTNICPICGGRQKGDPLSVEPNASGNFCHRKKLCRASEIWSRILFEKGTKQLPI